MIRTGQILEVVPALGQVRVAVDALTGCERCRRGRTCGLSLTPLSSDNTVVSCRTSVPLVTGQRVSIEMQEADSRWLKGLAFAYGLPLAGLLGGALFGALFGVWVLETLLAAAQGSDALMSGLPGVQRYYSGGDKLREIVVVACSLTGLLGGLFAWRKLSAEITDLLNGGPCLNNARIVAAEPASLETLP